MPTVVVSTFSSVRTPVSPPLKWAGGKRWLVPYLRELWAGHTERRLVEPFCGGLAVSLGLVPERALLNDINPHLINFYRWVQWGFRIRVPLQNTPALYYQHRKRFNDLITSGRSETTEAASLFYFLNRSGYNGLCRFNRKGTFNVPFGRHRTITYMRDFEEHRSAIAGWEFHTTDFSGLPLEPGDFVYADPPYDVEFTSYAKEGFGWEDQVRLARLLADHPGPVVLSNQATTRIVKLYRDLGFGIQFLQAPRMISCTGDRSHAREVLATRNLADGNGRS